ncbi:replicative DNA helicase [Micromonospora sp. HSS6-12]|uniref:Replicative DNA helicase n=2 Tax=Micromonospora thermarum TaxID=2720024 RepID=A0ABX0YYG4_9ACTN|nr:replicative DNA helicase [Micromonospora thermarum]NJP30537.1 replicative DNA helicase [Micromonospora thermarum]
MRADPRSGGQPPAPAQRDGQFEKAPPQDIAAEQCVLGGMLLSKDAIADVVEILKSNDFYRPIHATIFDTILEIYGRGEPADSITVAAALADSGDLVRIGGAPYLHTLIASVPTAANAAYYARIVSERAVLRRLVEAGTRIVQLGYGTAAGGSRDVDDIVDLAQQAVYDVTERRVSEDFAVLADMLQPTLDEIEAVGAQGGVMTGVPTGFTDLDRLLNGLHPGQLIIVAGRPGLGKALALDTPLPTPDGWTTMGEVKVGDHLLDAEGRPTRVTAAFEVRHDRPCYEVEFSDGSVIVADAEHLWKTTTRAGRRSAAAPRQFHWSPRAIEGLREAHHAVSDGQTLTVAELVDSVGAEFAHTAQRVARNLRHSTRRGGPGAGRGRSARAYPDRELYGALLHRVDRWREAMAAADRTDVVTTEQIRATLRTPTADRRLNHAVRNAKPLQLPGRDLPVPPYTLGAWLGDGHSAGSRITTADPEILEHIRDDGFVSRRSTSHPMLYTILPNPCGSCGGRGGCPVCHHRPRSLSGSLRALGALNNKHIPQEYLRASEQQRRALLAGLLDTDGTVTSTGNVEYTTTSRVLAEDVHELVVSLGYRCSISRKPVRGRTSETSTAYNLNFTPHEEVFRLTRKRDLHTSRRRASSTARTDSRFIVDVRPVPSVPVRCVTVDNPDHLYLAGRAMIPTHNSTASMDFARNAAIRANQASAIFSLEMSKVEIVMRLLSAEARVPLHVLRSGQLSDDDWTKLARCMGEISEAPLFVDDTPSMNLMEIRAKARRLKQKHDLKLIVVDYLQLMTSPKRTESRQQEVADLSRGLKLLAKEVECPVIAVSQLNRGPEQRTDKRPQLSDLRESGSIEQDADVVILLHRDDYYDKESPRAGEADFIIAKHRNGPTDTVTVAAQLHLSRFVDMAIV